MTHINWLFPLLFLSLWIAPSGVSYAQGVADQARTWFVTKYAPLWKDLDQADPERIRQFWAEDFRDHPIDMDPSIWENTKERWERNMDRYKAEGLIGSTVVDIQVEEINDRAVLIRTKWRDYGQDGQIEDPYCGTFIAGKFDQEWKFTNYFTVKCSPE
jgi:hypothetical protein